MLFRSQLEHRRPVRLVIHTALKVIFTPIVTLLLSFTGGTTSSASTAGHSHRLDSPIHTFCYISLSERRVDP